MRSPFAGMDPYLEPHWPDVHHRLVTYTSDWLNEQLPADLVASTEERVAIDSGGDELHIVGSDVKVTESPGQGVGESSTGGMGAAIVAPFRLVLELDPEREAFVRVTDTGGRLVTVIEYVSPANKRGEGLIQYRRKRAELLAGGVHVVEIDLVRAGGWRGLMEPARLVPAAVSPYRAIVRLGGGGQGGFVYLIGIATRADDVPVPLRPWDPQVRLPLQTLVGQVYERGRYRSRIDYTSSPGGQWSDDEVQLIDEVIRGEQTR